MISIVYTKQIKRSTIKSVDIYESVKSSGHPKSKNASLKSLYRADGLSLTLNVIIQNYYALGMTTICTWCDCKEQLKKEDVRKDPIAMNIAFGFASY